MNSRVWLIGATSIVLACNFLFLPAGTATPEAVISPTEKTSEVDSPSNIAPMGFSIVRLHPGDGDLQIMLANEAQKAMAAGQMPVVEFDATWCPPCRAIEKAFAAKNKLILKAYDGTYIIKLYVDEWKWKDGRVQNFSFGGIPVYFKLNAEGKQTGEVIDGGAWNEDIPENIAPVMDKFFHGE